MRKPIAILIALFASNAFAQTQADVDHYARRESELAGSAAQQERVNASLRNQLRGQPTQSDELIRVSSEAAALRKRVAELRIRRDVARDKLQASRDRLLEQAERADELRQAQKSVTDTVAELDKVSAPILARLQESEHYQEAQALADAAAQAGEALQIFGASDKTINESDTAFEAAAARVRALEDAAVDADPKARDLKKSLKVAEDAMSGLRLQQDDAIENAPEIVIAKRDLDAEQKQFDGASAELSDAEKRLSALRQPNPANDEIATQLQEGEKRLADLNDQLDQARIARQDADDRLKRNQDAIAYEVTTVAYDPNYYYAPTYYSTPSYSYFNFGYSRYYGGIRHCYPDYWYPSSCYYPRYYYPSYGYGYGYYGYPGNCYGSSFYGSYWGGGWSFGIGFGLGYSSFYKPYYHHPYSYGHGVYYGHNNHHDHSGGHYRSRDDFRNGSERSTGRSGKSVAWQRSNGARDSVAAAQQSTRDAGRDYRWRTGSNYASASGSSRALASDDVTRRVRDYQQNVNDRRAAVDAQSRRAVAEASVQRAAANEPSRSTRSAETRTPAVVSNRGGRDENPIVKELGRGRAADEARADQARVSDARNRSSAGQANQERLNDSRARASESVRRAQEVESPRSSRGGEGKGADVQRSSEEAARARGAESSRARAAEANQERLNDSRARAAQNVPRSAPRESAPAPIYRGRESAPSPPPPSAGRGGGGGREAGPPPSASSRGGGGGGAPRSSAGSSSRGGGGGSSGGGGGRGGGGGGGGGRGR